MRCDKCNGKIFFEDETQKCLRCGKEKYVPRPRVPSGLTAFKGNVQLVRHESKAPVAIYSNVTDKGTTIQLRPKCPYCENYMYKTSHGYHTHRHLRSNFKCAKDHQVVVEYGEGKNIVGGY